MSKIKYYAVRVGKVPGIYFNWSDCSAQVNGYKGAEYKSFLNLQEAEDYINNGVIKNVTNKSKEVSTKNRYTAGPAIKVMDSFIDPKKLKDDYDYISFVDGSYDKANKIYGSGVIVLNLEENKHEAYMKAGYDKYNQWNIVGELEAVKMCIDRVIELNKNGRYIKNIAIYHDLKNIALWANGSWKANNEYTQDYVRYIRHVSKELNILFVKVKAHSNESVYNDLADNAAKEAIKQYLRK